MDLIHKLPADLQSSIQRRIDNFHNKCDRKMTELMACINDYIAELAFQLCEDLKQPPLIGRAPKIEEEEDTFADFEAFDIAELKSLDFGDDEDDKQPPVKIVAAESKQAAGSNNKPVAETSKPKPRKRKTLYTSDEEDEDSDYFGDCETPKPPFALSTTDPKQQTEDERQFQLEFQRHVGLEQRRRARMSKKSTVIDPTAASAKPAAPAEPKPPKTRRFQCEICAHASFDRATLAQHISSKHTFTKAFHCDICKKGVCTKLALKAHMRQHTGERPLMCELCPQTFATHAPFMRHMRAHRGERIHKCTMCTKAFVERCDLKAHIQGHTGERPHRCPVCQQGFYKRFLVVRHLEKMHGMETAAADAMYPRKVTVWSNPARLKPDEEASAAAAAGDVKME